MTTVDITSVTRDPEYYLESYEFIVEDSLFKVPRRYFDLETSNALDDGLASFNEPIRLDAEKLEFECLLSVMYPTTRVPVTLSIDEWESVLKLSTAWGLCVVRSMAMDALSKSSLGSVAKALLGQTYKIPRWISEGYRELIRRALPISQEEGNILGGSAVSRICQLREKYIINPPSRPKSKAKSDVEELFSAELEDATAGEALISTMSIMMRELTSKNPEASLAQAAPSKSFYMEHVIFHVEDTLFKLPRASFEVVEPFSTMFSLPQTRDFEGVLEGSSDQAPLWIGGITSSDFRAFLQALYPVNISLRSLQVLSDGDWESILKLSTMWDFPDIQNHAIKNLRKQVDCVKLVQLSFQYVIPAGLPVALWEVVTRQRTIDKEESRLLGAHANGILRIREKLLMIHFEDVQKRVRAELGGMLDGKKLAKVPGGRGQVILQDVFWEKNPFKSASYSCVGKIIGEELEDELKECGAWPIQW